DHDLIAVARVNLRSQDDDHEIAALGRRHDDDTGAHLVIVAVAVLVADQAQDDRAEADVFRFHAAYSPRSFDYRKGNRRNRSAATGPDSRGYVGGPPVLG